MNLQVSFTLVMRIYRKLKIANRETKAYTTHRLQIDNRPCEHQHPNNVTEICYAYPTLIEIFPTVSHTQLSGFHVTMRFIG
jgi:hypothetical protein